MRSDRGRKFLSSPLELEGVLRVIHSSPSVPRTEQGPSYRNAWLVRKSWDLFEYHRLPEDPRESLH